MKILIYGGKGQLGHDFILGMMRFSRNYRIGDSDITDASAVKKEVENYLPSIIINCAAMTDVYGCEIAREKAWAINAIGPKNIALAAKHINAKVFQISTDFVFSGLDIPQHQFYNEASPVSPINHYGYTKSEGEIWTLRIDPENVVIRTSWLFGNYKNNFLHSIYNLAKVKEQIHEPLEIVDDQYGCPTSTVLLTEGITSLVLDPKSFGIYHCCSEGRATWRVLAEYFIKKTDIDVEIKSISSQDFYNKSGDKTRRPKNSTLESQRSTGLIHWTEHVDKFCRLSNYKRLK